VKAGSNQRGWKVGQMKPDDVRDVCKRDRMSDWLKKVATREQIGVIRDRVRLVAGEGKPAQSGSQSGNKAEGTSRLACVKMMDTEPR
jgi:hypothetical protein